LRLIRVLYIFFVCEMFSVILDSIALVAAYATISLHNTNYSKLLELECIYWAIGAVTAWQGLITTELIRSYAMPGPVRGICTSAVGLLILVSPFVGYGGTLLSACFFMAVHKICIMSMAAACGVFRWSVVGRLVGSREIEAINERASPRWVSLPLLGIMLVCAWLVVREHGVAKDSAKMATAPLMLLGLALALVLVCIIWTANALFLCLGIHNNKVCAILQEIAPMVGICTGLAVNNGAGP